MLPPEQMRAVFHDAGTLVGLADGRSVGYGRFEVLGFAELSRADEVAA
jgi:hypothetical protein